MNRIYLFIALLTSIITASADNYTESYNVISDNYFNEISDVPVIRNINGGSVIIPIFDESCPEEIKAPFSYACKIVEEYMPPCLPLTVNVSFGRVNNSTPGAISKVLARNKENFGKTSSYANAPMSMIKGVILSELCYNSTATYLDSVPDIEFLTSIPDIYITYNNQKINDISFSLDPNPGSKYDFVSLAMRDIIKGLGLSHSFRYNNATGGLESPSQKFTPFESLIFKALDGANSTPVELLNKATQGELVLKERSVYSLKLYAPAP